MNVFLTIIAIFLGISIIEFIIIIILSKLLEKKNKEIFRINKQTEIDKEQFRNKLKKVRSKNEKEINNAGSIGDLINITYNLLSNDKHSKNK